jgi:Na+-driven multidrug efflux pump
LRLPLAYLFAFVLGWESLGIYIAWIVGNVISALVTLYLFRRGGWQKATIHTRTPEPPPPEGGSSG